MKILMVCLGNICRSPLAEGILRDKTRLHNLDWEIDSAGTGMWHTGEAPDPRSVQVAQKHGIDISDQRARTIKPYDLEVFDLIYAMDSSNYRNILALAQSPEEEAKVQMIMNEKTPGGNQSVPDPYWDDDGFEKVFQMLDQAAESIVEKHS